MKESINHQLTVSYVFVDNFFKAHPAQAQWRTSNHNAPLFSDAEVLTIALMQGYFGCATLKQTYDLVRANAEAAFPHLCSYQQWLARLHALSPLVGRLVLVIASAGAVKQYYLMDSKPIPVCHPIRPGRVVQQNHQGLVLRLQTARACQSTGVSERGAVYACQYR
jgi:hypothetical protein